MARILAGLVYNRAVISPLLLALSVTLAPGQDWFYPGGGDEIALLDRDGRTARLGGVAVELTGFVLARVDDPRRIGRLAEVDEVVVLGGDGHVVRVRPRPGSDEIALARTLHERDDVAWAHPDFALELVPYELPNDPYARDQWHLDNVAQRGGVAGADINAGLAWTRSTGKGGIVAVIDSGVDLKHPDLVVQAGHDYINRDADPSPDPKLESAPHGTAVAGTAAAIGNNRLGVAGVAWGSTVYAIRLIGGRTSLSDFYSAFGEAVDAGAWVINNSWGFNERCDALPELGVYHDAMEYAETEGRGGLGAAVVFSAGNGNCDIAKNGLLAQPEVITVAATSASDRREGYSSFGAHVDVAAPSGNILTTDISGKGGYGKWKEDENYFGDFSGTSASAPVVSGVLLLMFAANPRLTAAQARRILCDTAVKVDIDKGGYDETGLSPLYGCGRVDAGAAVMAVANTAPLAPVILSPGKETYPERVLLAWKPAVDVDEDWLSYRVAWRIAGASRDTRVEVAAGVTHLDLTGAIAAGTSATFTVSAVDLWGAGPPSAPASFAVVARPAPPEPAPPDTQSGCSCHTAGPPRGGKWAALAMAGFFVLARRRRGRPVGELPASTPPEAGPVIRMPYTSPPPGPDLPRPM